MTAPKSPERSVVFARVNPHTRHQLRILAAEEDRSMSELVEDALQLYFRRPAGTVPPLPRKRPSRAKKGLQKDFNRPT